MEATMHEPLEALGPALRETSPAPEATWGRGVGFGLGTAHECLPFVITSHGTSVSSRSHTHTLLTSSSRFMAGLAASGGESATGGTTACEAASCGAPPGWAAVGVGGATKPLRASRRASGFGFGSRLRFVIAAGVGVRVRRLGEAWDTHDVAHLTLQGILGGLGGENRLSRLPNRERTRHLHRTSPRFHLVGPP